MEEVAMIRFRRVMIALVAVGVAIGAFFGGRASVSQTVLRTRPSASSSITPTTTQSIKRTTIDVFAPWTEGDKLSPGIKVTGHLTDGSCWTSSIADSADNAAWRCMSPGVFDGRSVSEIHDPCFAPPDEGNVTEVACAESPWSGVELLKLTKPLSFSASGTPNTGTSLPWVMQLANGDSCGLITGAAGGTAGMTLNYGCRSGNASTPDMSTEPWTVEYLPNGSHVISEVDVVTAWH
jgi:hypothetical protein